MAIESVKLTLNGTTSDMTYNSETGFYELEVTAPNETSYNNNSGHYFPLQIKATDSAENSVTVNDTDADLGDNLRLRVKEKTAPSIVITSPTEDELTSNSKPTVNWTVTDSGAGVNPDTIGITINDGSNITGGITKTSITNGYQCSYAISEALKDGTNTIYIDATDYDDNNATQRSVTFIVDTVPPSLSVTSPTNNLVTNQTTVIVSGTTKDVTAGLQKVTVKINGGTDTELEIDSSGNFRKSITLQEGANTIVVKALDTIGMSSSVTRIVTLDTGAPVIEEITITPNPVNTGGIIKVSAKVTD